jgi:anti-sigma regulatory factor (Ser/Thr protein kinase)
LATTLGFSAAEQASVETTIAELALTMLTYARSGEIRLDVVTEGDATGLRVVARDWSLAGESFELSNVQHLADDFDVQRRAGRGTVVTVTKWLRSTFAAA